MSISVASGLLINYNKLVTEDFARGNSSMPKTTILSQLDASSAYET